MRMFKVCWLMLVLFSGVALQAQTVHLVQITDMGGEIEFVILTREQFGDLKKAIVEEARVFPTAMLDSKREWEADMRTKSSSEKVSFPSNRIKVRVAKTVGGDFLTQEVAEKKKAQFEERLNQRLNKELLGTQQNKPQRHQSKEMAEREAAKLEARDNAFKVALPVVMKKMGDRLGRPVPSVGVMLSDLEEEKK